MLRKQVNKQHAPGPPPKPNTMLKSLAQYNSLKKILVKLYKDAITVTTNFNKRTTSRQPKHVPAA
jgi:hypothetical protein